MEPTREAGVGPASGSAAALGSVVQIDEGRIQAHLDTHLDAYPNLQVRPLHSRECTDGIPAFQKPSKNGVFPRFSSRAQK
jgi:hypothetical protein